MDEMSCSSPLPTLEPKIERNPDGIISKSSPEESGEVTETKSIIRHPIINKVEGLPEELLA